MTTQHRPDGREQEDGMTDLTNFTDTSDVSDAAIEWVTSHGTTRDYDTVGNVRINSDEGFPEDRAIIIAARLIQQHRPDLLVDPVDAIVQQWADDNGMVLFDESKAAAKRLYLMGIEKGKGA